MEHMLKHPNGLGISDLANHLDFPKNSVYRIVNTLLDHGYVNRDPDTKRFVLSRKLFSMAYNAVEEKGLMENALDCMRELRDEVKETVLISIISDDEGLVLEQMPGAHSFRFVVEPGTRRALHASSHGKAIMAYLPDVERDALLSRLKLTRFTDRTITTRAGMLEEFEQIRERGYAFDYAEGDEGVHCVSAPVLNRQGVAVAALTTTGPAFRMPESSFDEIGRKVKKHADRVSRRLGYGLV
jgi:DNA-binding IclR family transcriptional regulator